MEEEERRQGTKMAPLLFSAHPVNPHAGIAHLRAQVKVSVFLVFHGCLLYLSCDKSQHAQFCLFFEPGNH